MKKKRCSVCCVVRPVTEFKRKYKTYKSCNKCSRYKQKYAQSKKLIVPSMILKKLFNCGQVLPQQFHQKYKRIKQLECQLINDIHNHFRSGDN